MMIRTLCLFAALHFSSAANAGKTTELEYGEFLDIALKIVEVGHGYDNVLVVLDHDNTLLKMPQALGSVAWWDWQFNVLNSPPSEERSRAFVGGPNGDKTDLLRTWGLIQSYSRSLLTDDWLPHIVPFLQEQEGFKVMVMSARGPMEADSAIREQLRYGMDFRNSNLRIREQNMIWPPYDRETVGGDYGFSPEEVEAFRLDRIPRPVTFVRGGFYVEGQHKGAMLRIFLQKTQLSPDLVVFVDDKAGNIEKLVAAAGPVPWDLLAIRYTAEDDFNEDFAKANKQPYISAWNQVETAFGEESQFLVEATLRRILRFRP